MDLDKQPKQGGFDIQRLFSALYQHMAEGVALHELLYDETGRPSDYRILDVNPQFESFTGFSANEVVGRTAKVVYGTGDAPYLEVFAPVAISGKPARLETYFPPLDRYYDISIAPMGKDYFATIFLDVTERKLQELALRENEWFLRESQRAAGVGSYRLDVPTGKWIASGVLDEIFGIDASFQKDVDGWLSLIYPEDQAEMKRHLFEDVVAQGHPFNHRYRIVRKNDQELRWLHGLGILERGKDGSPLRMIGTIQDVTPLVEKEQALRDKSEELDRFFSLALDLLCIANAQGQFIRVNAAWEQTLGSPISQLEGSYFLDFVHPEDRDKTRDAMSALAEGKTVIDFTNRYRRQDGSYRRIEWRSTAIPGGLVYAAARDITERFEQEKALKESEERFRRIFDLSPNPTTITEMDGTILACNEAFCTLTAYGRAEIIGHSALELGLWQEPTNRTIMAEALSQNGYIDGFEFHFLKRDGAKRVMQMSARVAELDGKQVVFTSARDVTDQRNLERQMLHSQKLESLGVLAGGIAHDFNNLLTGILGNADLARVELPPTSPACHSLDGIGKAARRAADLCRQLLAYSGKGRFVVEPVDLQDLVEDMGHLLYVSISKKAILKYHFTQDLPAVDADATQLRQVVMNLIVNASEAIGERSGLITITTGLAGCNSDYLKGCFCADDLQPGDFVYLEVSDTGRGMDRVTQDRIFDPFFTTKFTGRGLGLAAVLGIVRGHHGAIKVYSEPERGTTFKLLFPASEKHPQKADTRTKATDWKGQGTVLLVDDEETIRSMGRRMLERYGFTVFTACDGREAVELFQREGPSVKVIVLDLTMPHLDGEACYRALRQIQPDVKVILSSGYNEQDVVNRFAGKGLAGFIQKPYTAEELIAKVREALGE